MGAAAAGELSDLISPPFRFHRAVWLRGMRVFYVAAGEFFRINWTRLKQFGRSASVEREQQLPLGFSKLIPPPILSISWELFGSETNIP